MTAQQFHLVTEWHFDAPIERVWAVLIAPDDWPSWWRAVKRVEILQHGDAAGVGAVRRFTWGTALPYTVIFDMTATRIEPMRCLEGRARGELDGVGLWTVTPAGDGTDVRYDWDIAVTRAWQRMLAPVLKPVFAWNHGVVMGWGYEGLVRRLRDTAQYH
jgi:uncharacterized protein YndB with AHSA1/START domain